MLEVAVLLLLLLLLLERVRLICDIEDADAVAHGDGGDCYTCTRAWSGRRLVTAAGAADGRRERLDASQPPRRRPPCAYHD